MWQFLLQSMRWLFLGSNQTALAVLHTYSGIALSEPGQHPVIALFSVNNPSEESGVWVVPQAILATLRKHGHSCRYSNATQLLSALRAEKLLGPEDKPKWLSMVIGHGQHNLPCYLIPTQILDANQLHFPR